MLFYVILISLFHPNVSARFNVPPDIVWQLLQSKQYKTMSGGETWKKGEQAGTSLNFTYPLLQKLWGIIAGVKDTQGTK